MADESFRRHWETGRGGKKGARSASAASSTYYDVPVIHKPHWKWLIVVYFFLGGISGASYVIATISQLVGPTQDRRIVQVGRYLSLAALIPSPVLLILDLGRPERFHHMLRVVKLRSPMSIGTWGLTIFGAFSTTSAAIQAAEDGLLGRTVLAQTLSRMPGRAIGAAGLLPAFFVGGYTGVLLAATAVPLWAKNALLMGPLFLSSAVSTAASAISLVLAGRSDTPPATLARLERVERAAMLSEIGLLAASGARLGSTAKPVVAGRNGRLLAFGTVCSGLLAPLAINVANRSHTRRRTALAALLTLVGGFILRYVAVVGGVASADDPRATFDFTRATRSGSPRR